MSRTPRPILPASCTGVPFSARIWGDQGRGRGFAVRTGDRDDAGRCVHVLPPVGGEGPEEQPDIVVDRNPGLTGRRDRLVRRGVKMRDAGAGDQHGATVQRAGTGQVGDHERLCLGRLSPLGAIVPTEHVGPTGRQGARRRQAGTAKPKNRNFPPLDTQNRDHGRPLRFFPDLILLPRSCRQSRMSRARGLSHQRSFSVASPISARISEMIQKRMTICGSAHPRFSKWWWIGAIRNTRLPVRLK